MSGSARRQARIKARFHERDIGLTGCSTLREDEDCDPMLASDSETPDCRA